MVKLKLYSTRVIKLRNEHEMTTEITTDTFYVRQVTTQPTVKNERNVLREAVFLLKRYVFLLTPAEVDQELLIIQKDNYFSIISLEL